MNKVATIVGSALLGLGICGMLVWLSNVLGIGVRFPSPGGEDDFSRRAAYFLFGVCPAFLILGAWIGYVSSRNKYRFALMWLGALAGTLAVWLGTLVLRSQIEQLIGEDSGTSAVAVFYGLWVLLSVLGAAIACRVLPK
ncbi:hypothetical protein [Methylomonas albis]|jgi:hypothetical protein|uniref:Uncharacterized protein n=1 Tax=Methylomonas albis TaxID=1854563 RepID=A0ABR9DA76_9GAMM|nr:hypothetical protein [Methylomonas albis]MBD9358807.1 hypothetical protein [Methylomonas albis]